MKPVIIDEGRWAKIYLSIAQNYPPSVLLISDRTRKVLGFTVRRHTEPLDEFNNSEARITGNGWRKERIHLDFYDEPKRTMFLLKYSDILNEKDS